MGFGSILRNGIALADKLTGGSDGFQDTVTMFAWIGFGIYAEPLYGPAVPVLSIVTMKQFQRKLPNGDEVTQRASFDVLRPIAPNGAKDRREPVDPRDKFVLPNGYTGPILEVSGPDDPQTHAPFVFTIALG